MSSHTYLYQRLKPQPTKEEIVENFRKRCSRFLRVTERIIKDNEDRNEDDYYPYDNKSDAEAGIARLKWMLEHADNCFKYKKFFDSEWESGSRDLSYGADLYEYAVLNYETKNFKKTYYDDETDSYYVETNPTDLFRINDDCTLRSREETEDYLKKHNIELEHDSRSSLISFWIKNPDGIIIIG